jgi:hypothetical protein
VQRFSLIVIFFFTLVSAQTTPVLLPLSLGGTTNQLTPNFITTASWQVQAEGGEGLSLYLYDATTGKTLRKLSSGDSLQETGTFYIYVVAPDNAPWNVVIVNEGAISPETTDTTPNTDMTTTPDTTTPEPLPRQLPPVDRRTERNWNRHYGFEVSRFARTGGATPSSCISAGDALEAQGAFIEAGGPELDPNNLDPDGDGYACSYNPFDESYVAAITCETGKQWTNPFYRRNGSYFKGGCRTVSNE